MSLTRASIVSSLPLPPEADIETAIVASMSADPHVAAISIERAPSHLRIFVHVDAPTAEVRERIFVREFQLIDTFGNRALDFTLTASPFIGSDTTLLYTRSI